MRRIACTSVGIKKVSTAIHYVTLIAFGYMYLMDHEYMKPCSVVTLTSFLLAYFVPPTGMIKPDDVPEYAKTSCGWVVNKEEVANRLVEEMKAKKEMETKGKAKKESKKKK